MQISDAEFEKLVNEGFNAVSKTHMEKLENVAIVIDDEPSQHQRDKLKLRGDQSLFGLYEGVPLTQKPTNAIFMPTVGMPDKITIFKLPLLAHSRDMADLKEKVRNTVWHEIAHYFGLNHSQIHKLEDKD